MSDRFRYVPLLFALVAAGGIVRMGFRSADAGGVYMRDFILLPFLLIIAALCIQMFRSASGGSPDQ